MDYEISDVKLLRGNENKPVALPCNTHPDSNYQHPASNYYLKSEIDSLKAISENSIAMMAYLDPEFNIVRVNDAYIKGSGCSEKELIGKNHFAVFPNPANEAIFRQVRDTGQSIVFREKPFSYRDQPWRGITHWDLAVIPVKEVSGELRGFVFSLLETTAQKRAEEILLKAQSELEQKVAQHTAEIDRLSLLLTNAKAERKHAENRLSLAEANLRNIINSSTGGIIIVNKSGKVLFANPVAASLFNYKTEDFPGKTFNLPVDDGKTELETLSGDGEQLTIEMQVTRTSWLGEPAYLAEVRDVTQHKQTEAELNALSRRLVVAQEKERRGIARELHDQVGQSLTAIKLQMKQAERLPAEKLSSTLGEAQKLVDGLIVLVRNMSLNLRPSMLDDLGLLPTLLWHFERYTSQTGINVEFKHSSLKEHLPSEISTTAYRIIQEALTNVARHAGVKEVKVCVWVEGDFLRLKVEDEGKGFEPVRIHASTSGGLSGMRERARLLSGNLAIESRPGAGTCIIAELPLNQKDLETQPVPTGTGKY